MLSGVLPQEVAAGLLVVLKEPTDSVVPHGRLPLKRSIMSGSPLKAERAPGIS